MKTRELLLLFIAVLSIGFVSCGSDDDDDQEEIRKNEFVYGQQSSVIGSCYIASHPQQGTQILLIGEGITFDLFEPTGKGIALGVLVFPQDGTLEGEYTTKDAIIESEKSLSRLTIITFDGENPDDIEANFEVGSKITINKIADSEYEFIVNGTDENGKKVTAYYKGKISEIEIK